jgi:hypothetical protein
MKTITIRISEKAAKMFNSAFLKNGTIVKKTILSALKEGSINITSDLIYVIPFNEAGEGGLQTKNEKLYMVINW